MENKLTFSDLPELIQNHSRMNNGSKRLIIVLGLLGDFDSIEYTQELVQNLKKIADSNIQSLVIAIGDDKSAHRFLKFTGLPRDYLLLQKDNSLHASLNLYPGLSLPFPSIINLMIMCLGIGSPGTIKEVLRGYLGDKLAEKKISSQRLINITPFPFIKGSLFDLIGKEDFQRPFELASVRLENMIEVICNWNLYFTNNQYLTQRGGTFLFNEKGQLIYQYKTKGLLCFSENMSHPFSYLDPWFN